MFNEYNKLLEAKKLFTIERIEDKHKSISDMWSGLLYPSENGVFAYGYPALHLEIRVTKSFKEEDKFETFCCIKSIDDSGISCYGKPVTYETALDNSEKLIEFFESQEFECPSLEDLNKFLLTIGMCGITW